MLSVVASASEPASETSTADAHCMGTGKSDMCARQKLVDATALLQGAVLVQRETEMEMGDEMQSGEEANDDQVQLPQAAKDDETLEQHSLEQADESEEDASDAEYAGGGLGEDEEEAGDEKGEEYDHRGVEFEMGECKTEEDDEEETEEEVDEAREQIGTVEDSGHKVTARWGRRRRRRRSDRRRWQIKARAAAAAAANRAKAAVEKAKKSANKLLDAAVEFMKSNEHLKKLLPSCLSNGEPDLKKCYPFPSKASVLQKVSAVKAGLAKIRAVFSAKDIASWAKIIGPLKCDKTASVKYPTKVKMSWPPGIEYNSKDICVRMTGLIKDRMKRMVEQFTPKAKEIYKAVANKLHPGTENLPQIQCKSTFAMYFGAGVSVSAGAKGAFSAGLVFGCDGKQFKVAPFWSWFAGLTSNSGASVETVLGFAARWKDFWGMAIVGGGSAGAGVSGGASLAATLPSFKWKKKTVTVSKQVASIKVTKEIRGVPCGVDFTPPRFATLDFSVSVGAEVFPMDVSAGIVETHEVSFD